MFYRVVQVKGKDGRNRIYLYMLKSYWDKESQQAKQKVIACMGKVEGVLLKDAQEIFKRDANACVQCERMDDLTIHDGLTICLRCLKKIKPKQEISGMIEYKPLGDFYW